MPPAELSITPSEHGDGMVMSVKRHRSLLARWLPRIYFGWALLVFFGTIGGEGHDWWPIFLYPIIWPVSAIYESVSSRCFESLINEPKSAPVWVWTLNDYVGGAFYIVVGTIWLWFAGRIVLRVTNGSPTKRPEIRRWCL